MASFFIYLANIIMNLIYVLCMVVVVLVLILKATFMKTIYVTSNKLIKILNVILQ